MTDWLRTLEPPTGLFACNDIRGQQVLNVCRLAGVDIPDSIGVVSVDDDDAIADRVASKPQIAGDGEQRVEVPVPEKALAAVVLAVVVVGDLSPLFHVEGHSVLLHAVATHLRVLRKHPKPG